MGSNTVVLIVLAVLLRLSVCSRLDKLFSGTYRATGRSNKTLRLVWHTGMNKLVIRS